MKPAASRDRQREGLLATSYPQRRGTSFWRRWLATDTARPTVSWRHSAIGPVGARFCPSIQAHRRLGWRHKTSFDDDRLWVLGCGRSSNERW